MPTSLPGPPLPERSTTGTPEIRFSFIRSSACCSAAVGSMVSGFTTMPDSNFLTWRTCAACASGSRLRWMTPMPPACAMAIAICVSVTVSMAEAMIGILTGIERVTRERISTSPGSTSDRPGLIRTSSKVSPSRGLPMFFPAIANSVSPEKENEAGCRRLIKCPLRGVPRPTSRPAFGLAPVVSTLRARFLGQYRTGWIARRGRQPHSRMAVMTCLNRPSFRRHFAVQDLSLEPETAPPFVRSHAP